MELFLPGQVVSAENQGTFSDYHAPETANSNEFFTGQHAVTINSCGVFAEYMTITQSANKVYLGSRLSKN